MTGPLDGVTDTDGVICVFFMEEDNNGSGKVFCSLAADKPNTISSNFRRRFSMPPVGGGGGVSSTVCKKNSLLLQIEISRFCY